MNTTNHSSRSTPGSAPEPLTGPAAGSAPEPPSAPGSASPTPEQARSLLAQAQTAARSLPAPVPAALISYGILCAVGSLCTLAMYYSAQMTAPAGGLDPSTTFLIFSFVWIGIAIVSSLLFRERWRRGLGVRWGIYMAIWAVLWVLGMTLGQTLLGMLIAPAFVVPFMVAVATEAAKAKEAR